LPGSRCAPHHTLISAVKSDAAALGLWWRADAPSLSKLGRDRRGGMVSGVI
jgi:hypothetical protein